MTLLSIIKALFINSKQPELFVPEYSLETYSGNHLATVKEEAKILERRYGQSLETILYSSDFSSKLLHEIMPFVRPQENYSNYLSSTYWGEKHPFNFPGPFYTGASDTCGTGDREAPENVMYDSYCCEFIFKQPKSFAELLCIVDAAAVEVLDSYACNGNEHWTYQEVKLWWREKDNLLHQLNNPETIRMNGDRITAVV